MVKWTMLAILTVLATLASAQSIPLACDQYFRAAEACTRNLMGVYERANPKEVQDVRNALKALDEGRVQIRKQIAEQGSDAVAQKCAGEQFVVPMMNLINGLVVPLQFSRSLNSSCQRAMGEIRLPPGL